MNYFLCGEDYCNEKANMAKDPCVMPGGEWVMYDAEKETDYLDENFMSFSSRLSLSLIGVTVLTLNTVL